MLAAAGIGAGRHLGLDPPEGGGTALAERSSGGVEIFLDATGGHPVEHIERP
jgi:hypothetical protein